MKLKNKPTLMEVLIVAAIIATIISLFTGCKDATMAQFKALGKRHRVTLYAYDGHAIKSWIATGNVSNERDSDGWYFEDEETHRLVEITGIIVIEVIP